MEIDYFSAFIIGLMGSGHCIGMCGGITTMFTSSLAKDAKNHPLYVISYHIGRISSYALIGAIAGFTGSLAAKNIGLPITGLKIIAGIFLILLGLYMGQWLMWLTKVEMLGKHLWQYISPFSKKLLPVNNLKQALLLGALWGWLPCGLVYSTLTWSLASGSGKTGALIMMCFGLGTLPALLFLSFGIVQGQQLFKNVRVRKFIALLLIAYGIFTLNIAYRTLF
ncbi:cytochrome biogenesis protein [Thalassotalea insulae]|uniref:Cytochrome biogenesis protein n=1 Tax=Thalassotalea insulae TaxID=2056778 RepID=A0ABQ6GX02_9GAMM|nr:sulfite exporter TauE/SafE family protein [Thalassotalea insulae]GLX80471.1 cytochrome biogenesis protein [Thalassotalea insulae]